MKTMMTMVVVMFAMFNFATLAVAQASDPTAELDAILKLDGPEAKADALYKLCEQKFPCPDGVKRDASALKRKAAKKNKTADEIAELQKKIDKLAAKTKKQYSEMMALIKRGLSLYGCAAQSRALNEMVNAKANANDISVLVLAVAECIKKSSPDQEKVAIAMIDKGVSGVIYTSSGPIIMEAPPPADSVWTGMATWILPPLIGGLAFGAYGAANYPNEQGNGSMLVAPTLEYTLGGVATGLLVSTGIALLKD